MTERIDRVRGLLAERGYDGLIVSKPANIRYLTGATGTAAELLVTANDLLLLNSFVDITENGETAPDVPQATRTNSAADMATAVHSRGLQRVGIETHHLSHDTYITYQQSLDGVELCSSGGMVEDLRAVKDEGEIDLIQQGMQVNDLGVQYVRDHAREGMTEFELGVGLETAMREAGADGLGFLIVQFGENAAKPHHRFSQRALRQGDFILIDIGALHQGYGSDTTRTLVFGEPTERQRAVYEAVHRAQAAALSAVRAGVTGESVHQASADVIREAGYAAYYGHGVGHAINEGPRLAPSSTDILRPGHVVTIEPGIYIAEWGGVRVEDTVVVTEGGYRNLARFPKDLTIISAR
ncbi:MAG: Xaa-Pro peptidase family protein [Thermomicrobiales bacterium]|jgi:Xaa-Pro aminopeptidase